MNNSKISNSLKEFMPKNQQAIVNSSDEFQEVLTRLEEVISKMPKTYETENVDTKDKIVYLHYFYGCFDWYIIEKDINDGQHQAFGYAILGDPDCAEWGYISLHELCYDLNYSIELDFYWTPRKFSQINIS